MLRALNDGHKISEFPPGQYALVMGPGQLGVLPTNARFINRDKDILLIVS